MPEVARPRLKLAFLDLRSWNAERVAFLMGVALVAVSPIPFALEAGLHILFGVEAMTAAPALLLAGLALATGASLAYAAAGLATLVPVAYIVLYATRARVILDPLAGAEFVSQALLVAGALIAVSSGVAVLARERRGAATPLALALRARPILLALGLAALATGASAAATLATLQPSDAEASGIGFVPDRRIALATDGLAFVPSLVEIRVGEVTQIEVQNRDAMLHTFTYELDGRSFEHVIPPGATVNVLLRVDEPGSIAFWCAPHAVKRGDAYVGMVGTIVAEGAL